MIKTTEKHNNFLGKRRILENCQAVFRKELNTDKNYTKYNIARSTQIRTRLN